MEIISLEETSQPDLSVLETRSIWVVICGRPAFEGFRLWVHANSTFGDIKEELASTDPLNLAHAVILQAHYGYRPYWILPDSIERIGETCTVLYAVATGESEPFLLGLVRTPTSDYPIVIGTPSHPSAIRQAIMAAQPELVARIGSITEHVESLDIGDDELNFMRYVNDPPSTFPTVFCITTSEGTIDFLSEQPSGFIAPLLETPMVHCDYLLRKVPDLELFRFQVAHLLKASRHIILSIADVLRPLFDNQYSDLDHVLFANGYLADLLPVAPLLARQLKQSLDRTEQLMRVLWTEVVNPESAREVIDHLFMKLCGDFPGAVTVRHSYSNFKTLARSDYESLLRKYDDSGPPDDRLTASKVLSLQTSINDALKADLGDSHPETLKSILGMASTYTILGQYSEAKHLQSKALKRLKKRLGEKHQDTVTAMLNLSSTYIVLGFFSEAQKLGTDAVSFLNATVGKEHPDTYKATLNLAFTYHKQNRNSEAAPLQIEALEGLTTKLGQGHLDTINGARHLSLTYIGLGRYVLGETLQTQVLNNLKETLGSDHRITHATILELAFGYYKQARYSEAESLQVQSLDRLQFKLGEAHPEVFMATRKLALTLVAIGRYSKAENLQKSALEGLLVAFGEHHVEIYMTNLELSSTYYKQGRYLEAETTQLRCLEYCGTHFVGTHSTGMDLHTITNKRLIALTYSALGKFSEAANLQEGVLSGLRTILKSEHPDTYTALRERAWTHLEQGWLDDAIKLQAQALEGLKVTLGEMHLETLIATRDYASTYNALGGHSNARPLQESALRGLNEKLGDAHPDSILSMLSLAETYSALQLHFDARKIKEDALIGLIKTEIEQHAGILVAIYKLSLVYQSATAKSLAQKIQRIRSNGTTRYKLVKLLGRLDPVKKGLNSDAEMEGEDDDDDTVLGLD